MNARGVSTGLLVWLLIPNLGACGLETSGLLETDASSPLQTDAKDASTRVDSGGGTSDDGAVIGDDDGPIVGDDDGATGDDDSGPKADGSAAFDAGKATDAGVDAPPADCKSCVHAACASQVAACQAGSECLKYRDCAALCSASSSNGNCSGSCSSSHPGGAAAYGGLTLCTLQSCGAFCVTAVAAGTP